MSTRGSPESSQLEELEVEEVRGLCPRRWRMKLLGRSRAALGSGRSALTLPPHLCHQYSHRLVFPFYLVKPSESLSIAERLTWANMHSTFFFSFFFFFTDF